MSNISDIKFNNTILDINLVLVSVFLYACICCQSLCISEWGSIFWAVNVIFSCFRYLSISPSCSMIVQKSAFQQISLCLRNYTSDYLSFFAICQLFELDLDLTVFVIQCNSLNKYLNLHYSVIEQTLSIMNLCNM